jgi:proton-dependent oligopeptide transporter, POT family
LWLAMSAAGNLIAGWLGSLWSTMDKVSFFLMLAGLAALAGIVIFAFKRPLRDILEG